MDTCCDCGEVIYTYEEHARKHCHACRAPLHGECVMATPEEDDVCEDCYDKDARRRFKEGRALAGKADA